MSYVITHPSTIILLTNEWSRYLKYPIATFIPIDIVRQIDVPNQNESQANRSPHFTDQTWQGLYESGV